MEVYDIQNGRADLRKGGPEDPVRRMGKTEISGAADAEGGNLVQNKVEAVIQTIDPEKLSDAERDRLIENLFYRLPRNEQQVWDLNLEKDEKMLAVKEHLQEELLRLSEGKPADREVRAGLYTICEMLAQRALMQKDLKKLTSVMGSWKKLIDEDQTKHVLRGSGEELAATEESFYTQMQYHLFEGMVHTMHGRDAEAARPYEDCWMNAILALQCTRRLMEMQSGQSHPVFYNDRMRHCMNGLSQVMDLYHRNSDKELSEVQIMEILSVQGECGTCPGVEQKTVESAARCLGNAASLCVEHGDMKHAKELLDECGGQYDFAEMAIYTDAMIGKTLSLEQQREREVAKKLAARCISILDMMTAYGYHGSLSKWKNKLQGIAMNRDMGMVR